MLRLLATQLLYYRHWGLGCIDSQPLQRLEYGHMYSGCVSSDSSINQLIHNFINSRGWRDWVSMLYWMIYEEYSSPTFGITKGLLQAPKRLRQQIVVAQTMAHLGVT
jgi:hypothetical protein